MVNNMLRLPRLGANLGAAIVMLSAATTTAQSVAMVSPAESAPQSRVTVDVDNATLSSVVQTIARQARLDLVAANHLFDHASVVSLHVHDVPVAEAFSKALNGTGLRAEISPGNVVLLPNATAQSADGSVTGTVRDAKTKEPVRGVTIVLDDAKSGVVTDDKGVFHLTGVSNGAHVIHVRKLSYARRSVSVNVSPGETASLSIVLDQTVNTLDQVVVTGTVVATELKAIPNAITVITGKELEQRGITHIDQLFRGDVPGVWAQSQGSGATQPGQVTMWSRGVTTLGSSTKQAMKTYVDGVELADASYLGLIDPRSIERIEILSGPQASTIYGSGAINGVMQVFTKRGTTPRPQLTLNLQSGLVENNYNSARTPQHDYSAQLSGVNGYLSYNGGGSWTYTGPWTPSVHTATTSGFVGVRGQQGPFTVDLSLRRTNGTNWEKSFVQYGLIQLQAEGVYSNGYSANEGPTTYSSTAQTLGLTTTFAPVTWWSTTATVGSDVTNSGSQKTGRGYEVPYDSSLYLDQVSANKMSLALNTTVRIPLLSVVTATVTGGVDGWHSLSSEIYSGANALTGSLDPSMIYTFNRIPLHDRGAFVQGQVAMWDAVFLTYGLRAEWNPNYGREANPNLTPRYGIAYTKELGEITAKVRASYGRATRPPGRGRTEASLVCVLAPSACNTYTTYFGSGVLARAANPNLHPESQQGGEGGLELYFSNRLTLNVTRFNQTVNDLISSVSVFSDSIRSLQPASQFNPYGFIVNPDGYVYYTPSQYVNLGNVRNQGWSVQGTLNVGPLTTTGTYSWSKSRIIGVSPLYQPMYTFFKKGASYQQVPEHTYALRFQYAHGGTLVSYDIQGQGTLLAQYNVGNTALAKAYDCLSFCRNPVIDSPIYIRYYGVYATPGYSSGDLNASQRLSASVEGVLQIQNLGNTYKNDLGFAYTSIGRQSKAGLRIRW